MKSCPTCKALYPADYGVCPKDGAVLRPVTELEEGAVLRGKYQVLALLGRGGMGAVYKAKHLAFNELCALKVVKSALLEEPEFLKRFRAEAVTMRRLRHPHAVQVHDLDETEDGRPFIVMEYVEGQSLDRALAEDGPLDSARAVAIAAQVGSALATAHQLGIIHRDIKPSNILLARAPDSAEAAKVLDFGVAKVKEQA
ncbi:MAG: serine/threonine protein kinase, partial [Acidobacteria bacterium]|nr:serine/threonine protein kinase [Acidobacteriota bacterium]